jgi:hypothetical protein
MGFSTLSIQLGFKVVAKTLFEGPLAGGYCTKASLVGASSGRPRLTFFLSFERRR